MTLLSRKADYALLILAYLYERSEGANARVIAERYDLSRAFVANILKELAGQGFVASHRGVKGGYVLKRSMRESTLASLLDAIGEGFQFTVCSTRQPGHETCGLEHACPVKSPLDEIHRRLNAVLSEMSLAELFQWQEPTGRAKALPMLTIHQPEPKA